MVSPSSLVQSGPAVVEIKHPLRRDVAPRPAFRLLSGYFLPCLAFSRANVVPGYKHCSGRLYERGGHADHNSYLITGAQNSRNAEPGFVTIRQFVLTSASCRIEVLKCSDNTDEDAVVIIDDGTCIVHRQNLESLFSIISLNLNLKVNRSCLFKLITTNQKSERLS